MREGFSNGIRNSSLEHQWSMGAVDGVVTTTDTAILLCFFLGDHHARNDGRGS